MKLRFMMGERGVCRWMLEHVGPVIKQPPKKLPGFDDADYVFIQFSERMKETKREVTGYKR